MQFLRNVKFLSATCGILSGFYTGYFQLFRDPTPLESEDKNPICLSEK